MSVESLAIIPARGDSKRIPKKNLACIAGKPLVGWAILTAKKARNIDDVLVSTDSEEIAAVARRYGASVPWRRPKELSRDKSSTLGVILHALKWASSEYRNLKYAVLLEPTAPLRTAAHIDRALELLASSKADSVVSVSKIPHVLNPEELLIIQGRLLMPYLPRRTMSSRRLRGRQAPVYVANGIIYAFRVDSVLKNRNLYGKKCIPYHIDWNRYLDIDTSEDLRLAEWKFSIEN